VDIGGLPPLRLAQAARGDGIPARLAGKQALRVIEGGKRKASWWQTQGMVSHQNLQVRST
jgi:hypothetical protein